MKTTISKKFDFDAAHFLPHVCEGHKCGRMHGHTYVVELIFSAPIDPCMGWFVDYADISAAWAPLNETLDHRVLNSIEGLFNPTTEELAAWIFRRMAKTSVGTMLTVVRVYESATTWCEVAK